MQLLLTTLALLLSWLFNIAAQVGTEMLPQIEDDLKNIFSTVIQIAVAFVSAQLSASQSTDSLEILFDTLRAQGATLIGKLQVEAMKLPAELIAEGESLLGAAPGAVLSLLGL
jgi:hypothetical protein